MAFVLERTAETGIGNGEFLCPAKVFLRTLRLSFPKGFVIPAGNLPKPGFFVSFEKSVSGRFPAGMTEKRDKKLPPLRQTNLMQHLFPHVL